MVREARRRLHAEGLVDWEANRGATVPAWNIWQASSPGSKAIWAMMNVSLWGLAGRLVDVASVTEITGKVEGKAEVLDSAYLYLTPPDLSKPPSGGER